MEFSAKKVGTSDGTQIKSYQQDNLEDINFADNEHPTQSFMEKMMESYNALPTGTKVSLVGDGSCALSLTLLGAEAAYQKLCWNGSGKISYCDDGFTLQPVALMFGLFGLWTILIGQRLNQAG